MDPGHALMSDQQGFQQELDQMIRDALSGPSEAASTLISPLSPPPDADGPQDTSRKRAIASQTPPTEDSPASLSTKRLKLDEIAGNASLRSDLMHPDRTAKLDQAPTSPRQPSSSRRDSLLTVTSSVSAPLTSNLASASAANAIPLGGPVKQAQSASTWSTLSNTVRRQWDPRKSDLEYEELLRHRSREKLKKVDRYVPDWRLAARSKHGKKQYFPFEKLPGKVQANILSLLLVSTDPITIDFSWLRPFLKGHARIPVVTQRVTSEGGTFYLAPVSWSKMLADVQDMEGDMAKFKGALETRGAKTKGKRSPARCLTTSLLRASRGLYRAAARIFYGGNTFHFSYAPAAWMQLEAFLETIGPTNLAEVKRIRIAAPMFHRGGQEDYVEGAILDLMSPATRLATIKPPARDRLLSAIVHSTTKLTAVANLDSLAIDLEHPMASDLWCGRYVNDKRLVSIADVENFVQRKATAIQHLKQMSDMLTAKGHKPVVTLRHFTRAARSDVNQFRAALPAVITEADKYGWAVKARLEDKE